MSATADIFLVDDASRYDPVDHLGEINSLGPYPSSTAEVVPSPNGIQDDPTVRHECIKPASTSDVSHQTSSEQLQSRDNLFSPLLSLQKHDACEAATTQPINIDIPILQLFFDVSYTFFTSPFTRYPTRTCWSTFRIGAYWLLIVCSCLDAFITSNEAFTRKGIKDTQRYTEMGFHAVEFVGRLYHAAILWTLSDKLGVITRLLLRLDNSLAKLTSRVLVRDFVFNNFGLSLCYIGIKPFTKSMELPGHKAQIFLFGILPMMDATLWGIFGFWRLEDWSWIDVLFTGARDIGRTFLVWDMGNLDIANNKTEMILFVNTPDAVWIGLGFIRIGARTAACLQDVAMRNLLLAISLSLLKHTVPLTKVFKMLGKQLANYVQHGHGHLNEEYFEEAWKYYFRLRKTSIEVNKAFAGLVKFIHMTNMLMLMYFMLTLVLKQQTPITFVLFLYEIVLVVLFYVSGTMINETNDDARKWIKDNAIPNSPIEVDGRTLQILLDDIRQAPIGVGTGIAFVDGSLIQRFVGLLSSLLMFMLDADSQPEARNDNVV